MKARINPNAPNPLPFEILSKKDRILPISPVPQNKKRKENSAKGAIHQMRFLNQIKSTRKTIYSKNKVPIIKK
ncbi:MAG: hypothetical protein GY816_13350 [Cytophagales bacterium]|nr:hypothetical protein [Cytophagales bacterium]